MKKDSFKSNKLEQLKQLIFTQNKNNENKILIYENEITVQKEQLKVKYDGKVANLKANITNKKEQENKNYKAKGYALGVELATKLKKVTLNYKKTKLINKFDMKKKQLLQQHKLQQYKLQQKYETKSAHFNKWYAETIDDLEWDLNNFKELLAKNLQILQTQKLAKIKYHDDKEKYLSNYKLATIKLKSAIQQEKDVLRKKELHHQYQTLPLTIVTENNLSYHPWKVSVMTKIANLKNNYQTKVANLKVNVNNLKYLSAREILKNVFHFKIINIPLWLYSFIVTIVLLAVFSGTLPNDTMGAMVVLFMIALLGGEIFKRLPVWKKYLGGGTMGVFFLGAILGTFKVFPEAMVNNIGNWFSKQGFLNLYINVLIVGSILAIPRKLISRAFTGFMFLLVVGVLIAVCFALGFGQLVGIPLDKNVLQIILPLLSAGNGGGVQPLSNMAQSYGYMSYQQYVSFALAVSTLSNIFVIVMAALLVVICDKSPTLSGNGKLVKKEIRIRDEKINPSHGNICAGLILALGIYIFSNFLEIEIKKASHGTILINAFAWVVIIALLLNLFNILPKELKDGSNVLNKFFTKQFTLLIMAGVGLCMTDLKIFVSLFANWKYVSIILLMDIGLILGPLLLANLIKFYALESMIAAGCCMGAQGGAGSLAVLASAKRMDLVPYSQITARIAGGLILVVAAPLFAEFVKAGYVG